MPTRSSFKPGAFVVNALVVSTAAKLKRCQQTPMPGTATTNVEMTCLQGLADLERLEGPWLDGLATGDPEVAATTVRLLLAHLTWNSKRLLVAMVLDRLDAESLSTWAECPDRCQRLVNGLDSVNGLNL
ncbi:hypothetical protein [Synechococcus sp. A15-60]|uniref:hypothetical protein n=1 Tax=Synechococcus sp. A15-60 TaxID=1050655 RepID=UPI00164707CF|nr:hypothetical protein [Synechococcus sp. A15-60]